MRKVLLTTTALVALGGVSAASAIDISGTYMFDYTINDNGTANTGGNNNSSMGSDARIAFSGSSTTDAGITFGGAYALSAAGGVEDQGIYMEGDFGYVMLGATDGVVDNMDTFMHSAAAVEVGAGTTNSGTTGPVAAGLNGTATLTDTATAEKVGYRSPEISGFQFGFSHQDAGRTSKADNNQWIATYDFGVAKIGYASATIGAAAGTEAKTKQTQYGFGTTFGDFGFKYAVGSDKTQSAAGLTTSSIDTINYGFSYGGIENVSLYYDGLNSEQKTGAASGNKLDGTTIGLSYTVAPGVSALVESGNNDFTHATATSSNDQANYTRLGLSVNF